MATNLWGDKVCSRRRRKRKAIPLHSATPFSITGESDCEIIGHTLSFWSLAGTTTCLDCGVRIFCPGCTSNHPQDTKAIPVLCELHAESERTVAREQR
jgi:hypothetical protein